MHYSISQSLNNFLIIIYFINTIVLTQLTSGLAENSNPNVPNVKRHNNNNNNIKKLHKFNNLNHERNIDDEQTYLNGYANTRSINSQQNEACHLNIECNSKPSILDF